MNAMRVINRKGRAMGVVAAMMITMIPVPARAQILGGIVYDPTNYALQVEKRVEEAARWVQTIDQHKWSYATRSRSITGFSPFSVNSYL